MREKTQSTVIGSKSSLRKLGFAAAGVAFALAAGSAGAAETLLWDWRAGSNPTPVSGYIPVVGVNDANAGSAAIINQLTTLQAQNPGKVTIKVDSPTGLSPASITSLFNNPNFTINYTFLDIEAANSTAIAQSNANAIHNAAKGTGTFVGNYRLFPGNGDNSGFASGPTLADYQSGGPKGVNMANPDLYPGQASYKTPASLPGGTSTSPNIRSTLFTLPIKRETYVTANLPVGNLNVPYVNRFNNFGNLALDSDNNPANGFAFVQNNATPSKGQLLSRGDFKAMVAHYRLRGADGIHILDGGVQGYDQVSFATDAKAGWSGITPINDIFKASDASIATLDTVIKVGGVKKDFEAAGVVFSGVYSLSQNKLALLVSNLTEAPTTVGFPARIGSRSVPDVGVGEGEHVLLQYTGVGSQWVLSSSTILFTSAAETDRNGVGVPEPLALGSLSLVSLGALLRRSRRKA